MDDAAATTGPADLKFRALRLGVPVDVTYEPDTNSIVVYHEGDRRGGPMQRARLMPRHPPLHMDGNRFVSQMRWLEVDDADRDDALRFVAEVNEHAKRFNADAPGSEPGYGRTALDRLESAVLIIQVIAFITFAAGVVLGTILVLHTDDSGFGDSRPYLGIGVGVIASSAVQASLLWFAAAWADAWRSVQGRPSGGGSLL